MARIPTRTSQIGASSGRTNATVGSRAAGADAFGGSVAGALTDVSRGLDQAAVGLQNRQTRQRQEELANRIAKSDFTAEELTIRNSVGADAAGYQERVLDRYDEWVDEQASGIEDNETRSAFLRRMNENRANVSSRSATYEFGTAATNSENEANEALNATYNKIRLNPDSFDEFAQQGVDVIQARGNLNETAKNAMSIGFRQNAARARFDGLLERATSVEDIDAVEAEIRGDGGKDWASELSATSLGQLQGQLASTRQAFVTKFDADARAALDTVEARATDPTITISPEELASVAQVVSKSENPVTAQRMARVMRDQEIVRQSRLQTPSQMRQTMEAEQGRPRFTPTIDDAINESARIYGVSGSFMAGLIQKEYGGQIKMSPEGVDVTDYGVRNGASSATGVGQHIDSTFLAVARAPGFAEAVGMDIASMNDDQVLALRRNGRVSVIAAAAYAAQNSRTLSRQIGRRPSDAELYMAHFLGPGGAATLIQARNSRPDANAAEVFPAQADANTAIFYRNGKALTVAEVYNRLGAQFGSQPTQVQYGDMQTRQTILDDAEKRLAADPMAYAAQTGTYMVSPLDGVEGFAARGEQSRAVADYYNIPQSEMKPFQESEVASLSQQMKDGSADDVLTILSDMRSLGPGMMAAGLKQLGTENDVYALAGTLQAETGNASVAGDIIRGAKRREENPAIRDMIGMTDSDLNAEFYSLVGPATAGLQPGDVQAVIEAAKSHYVETVVARGGKGAGSFDQRRFQQSVMAVMGGTQGQRELDTVNGVKTILPSGLDGGTVERAMQNMTVTDWVGQSSTGEPPRYLNGSIADPEDLADEAVMKPIGGGEYAIEMADGTSLITGNTDQTGRLELYRFVPDVDRLRSLAGTVRQRGEDLDFNNTSRWAQ